MLVVCPPGLGAGDLVLVDFEGAELEVIVPDGVAAGDEFEVAGMVFEEEGESPADIHEEAAEADGDSSASSTLRISATAPAPSHLVDSQPWDDSRRLRSLRKEAWALMELEAQRAAQLDIESNHVNLSKITKKVLC
jgi:hypothetical protein